MSGVSGISGSGICGASGISAIAGASRLTISVADALDRVASLAGVELRALGVALRAGLAGALGGGEAALRVFDFCAEVFCAEVVAVAVVTGLAVGVISWGERDAPLRLRAFDGVAAVPPAPFAEGFCPFRGVVERLSLGLPSCRCLLILLPPVPASCGCAALERPASRM